MAVGEVIESDLHHRGVQSYGLNLAGEGAPSSLRQENLGGLPAQLRVSMNEVGVGRFPGLDKRLMLSPSPQKQVFSTP